MPHWVRNWKGPIYDDDDDEWFLLKKDLMINLACTFLKPSIFNQTST